MERPDRSLGNSHSNVSLTSQMFFTQFPALPLTLKRARTRPRTAISRMRTAANALLCGLAICGSEVKGDVNNYVSARAAMIQNIQDYAQARDLGENQLDPAVLAAMNHVPRHEFVPAYLRDSAYENHPLPIGHGQTISQPYIVALMTDLLDVQPDDSVLEVGTGSGYQAAVLAELAGQVYTIEIIEPLATQAAKQFAPLGYDNLTTRTGDGYNGWPQQAPFDAIMVTAGADRVPPPLVRQLKPGGTMIIPVNSSAFSQNLTRVQKTPEGDIETRQLLPVLFVPLTGDR